MHHLYFWGGQPFLTGAVSEIRSRMPGTMLLIGLAITVASSGMIAEVADLETLDVVDLPTGHWPMWSRPEDLARAVVAAARTR